MTTEFLNLTEEERELMYKVPILVSILVAGADDVIDKTEIRKAVEISTIKKKNARAELLEYYKEVAQDFEDKMKILIQDYPQNALKRNPLIVAELERLNGIFPKLERRFAVEFYASIKDLAKKVAEASGGVLGYMAIGYEESKVLDLKMIKDPAVA